MPGRIGVDILSCIMYNNPACACEAKEKAEGVYSRDLSGAFTGGIPGDASCCVQCGECEEKCPQHLPVREHLQDIAEFFGNKKNFGRIMVAPVITCPAY